MAHYNTVWECANVSKSYGANRFQLGNIDLQLNAGEITGVVGENGNGKTTLLRLIAGDLAADTGDMWFMGRLVNPEDWTYYKSHSTYIPQRIPKWWGYLRTNLIFHASIHGVPANEIDQRLETLLFELGLQEYADLKWSEISTGWRLRFQLAKMLIARPNLLILDEPIANLDIKAQERFLMDLKRIVSTKEFSCSVILSSQQLHEVEAFSDNIVFIQKGVVKYSGKVGDVGKERRENVIELAGNITEERLMSLFQQQIFSIAHQGKNLLVTFDISVTPEQMLSAILKEGHTLSYYRDISSSTKKMFA
jgi:ABC-2 type transport system ATP-binding protein